MFKFDEAKFLANEKKAIEFIPKVEKIVDEVCEKGYSNIFFVGIGGTITYEWQVESIIKSMSTLDLYVENAAEFLTVGNKKFTKDSIVVIQSASGDTKEVVQAVDYAHEVGAKGIGFVEKEGSPLAKSVDYLILEEAGGTWYFWYTLAGRFMKNHGDFADYDKFMAELKTMPELLVDVKKKADAPADAYAKKHRDDAIQYLVGSGNLWGEAYCYAMCIMEEMQWMRTKSISGADFFHGTLEVIGRDDSVILFKGEDAARKLMDRVENFVNTICANVTVFDTADYELKGISKEFRGMMSPIVMANVTERISKYLEEYGKHPLAIRRYYRRLDY